MTNTNANVTTTAANQVAVKFANTVINMAKLFDAISTNPSLVYEATSQ